MLNDEIKKKKQCESTRVNLKTHGPGHETRITQKKSN